MSTVVLTAEIASPFAGLLGAWRLRVWWHRRRWLRCLANIKRLEIATGLAAPDAPPTAYAYTQMIASPYRNTVIEQIKAKAQADHDALVAATTKEANPELYAEMVKRGLR